MRSGFAKLSDKWIVLLAILLTALLFVGACTQEESSPPSPTPTHEPSHTPTSSPTPTPSATPTPTALPIVVAAQVEVPPTVQPVPQRGAPCGIVDTFDFPLNPPDGLNARGGTDFGVFRARFDGHHTGEDWGYLDRSNFGAPVYSIGHGIVTYASPLGWGGDKGTVIVKHVLPDGSSVLSFYGHLNEDNFTLREGDCVQRGDQVGQIGRPRTPPHLHFEIRLHWSNHAGPGYWSIDPRTRGWIAPTEFIEDFRFSRIPGVVWSQMALDAFPNPLGMVDAMTYATIKGHEIQLIDIGSGEDRSSYTLKIMITDLWFDSDQRILYIADFGGRLTAYYIPISTPGDDPEDSEDALNELWQVDLEGYGSSTVMTSGKNGFAFSMQDRMVGVSSTGRLIWEADLGGTPIAWTVWDNQILFTTRSSAGEIWTITANGPEAWGASVAGIPVVVGEEAFLYNEEGIYILDSESRSAELVYSLPWGYPASGDILAIPDRGVLVAHRDQFDQRLIFVDVNGSLQWERSYIGIGSGSAKLTLIDGNPYILIEKRLSNYVEVDLFAIDLETSELTLIFHGEARNPRNDEGWLTDIGNGRALLYIQGRRLLLLDVNEAHEAITR
ncbi:MAG: peptidoglycan DD-metalloendopeptidase family protein [Anaerolineales bacterium]|nr:peptidoglycan DD-metalloendopeptidase family protein [Anaerolineales bacterium]